MANDVLAFDIETIPDVEFGRKMWDLDGLSDEDIGNTMMFKQKQKPPSLTNECEPSRRPRSA